jgi:hypothetical protein
MSKTFSMYDSIIVLGIAVAAFIATNYSAFFEGFQAEEEGASSWRTWILVGVFVIVGFIAVPLTRLFLKGVTYPLPDR